MNARALGRFQLWQAGSPIERYASVSTIRPTQLFQRKCAPMSSRVQITGFLSKKEGSIRFIGWFALQFRTSDHDSKEIPFISKIRGVVM
jgi:hypothetical protein